MVAGGVNDIVVPLVNISTGEPSLVRPGQPLNCHVGPATNTQTTCFLYERKMIMKGGKGGEREREKLTILMDLVEEDCL